MAIFSWRVGPIIGVGGLAILIPPSALAVVFASIARISVSKMLIGGVIPGLLLGGLFILYILIRCKLQPSLAPKFEMEETSLADKLIDSVKYLLPIAFIIFMVLGLFMLGYATPSEAAASGCVATIIVSILYGNFSLSMMKKALAGTITISTMILVIVAASKTFSNMLAFSGATNGMLDVTNCIVKGGIYGLRNLSLGPLYLRDE